MSQKARFSPTYEAENETARKRDRSFGFVEKPELCKDDEEIPEVLEL